MEEFRKCPVQQSGGGTHEKARSLEFRDVNLIVTRKNVIVSMGGNGFLELF
jgi:hypothetical protein